MSSCEGGEPIRLNLVATCPLALRSRGGNYQAKDERLCSKLVVVFLFSTGVLTQATALRVKRLHPKLLDNK